MCLQFVSPDTSAPRGTPIGAAGRGIVGGLAGALLLSALSRILPALRDRPPPVGYQEPGGLSTAAPARALTVPQPPGPEGLAEQFAFKVASGVFGRDLGPHARLGGRAVHLAYGGAWGLLYGLLQASHRRPPVPFGVAYGLVVWLVGPGVVVPAMRLMDRPGDEPAGRTASLIGGHVAYGLALAAVFETLQRKV